MCVATACLLGAACATCGGSAPGCARAGRAVGAMAWAPARQARLARCPQSSRQPPQRDPEAEAAAAHYWTGTAASARSPASSRSSWRRTRARGAAAHGLQHRSNCLNAAPSPAAPAAAACSPTS
eukprot:320909-Chlamydomonas_euryale.AAC.2